MIRETGMLIDASRRLFGDLCTTAALIGAEHAWPVEMWKQVSAAGYPAALAPEARGGIGLSLGEGLAILRSAGEFGLPLPLAETMIAGHVLTEAGLQVPQGPLAFAVVTDGSELSLHRNGHGWNIAGTVHRVAGARHAGHTVICVTDGAASHVAVVATGEGATRSDENLARESRDALVLDLALKADRVGDLTRGGLQLLALGAAARCCQMAGALDRVLEITLDYAKNRVQFGRPLGKFQAVQQNLAILAAQVAAAGAAADMVIEAADDGLPLASVAAAKIRIGEAAGIAAGIAHQVHGAFGFTYEHNLHLFTKRLLAWREEFGSERYWSRQLGRSILAGGADALWPAIIEI